MKALVETLVLLALCVVKGQDGQFCAWNRGVQPVNENNAATYNGINGEYTRAYDVTSGGQTNTWHGKEYYKMTADDCYFPVLYLYRQMDSQVYPPTFTWVIATTVGTTPDYAYAYCGPYTTATVDLDTPDNDYCQGKWMVGDPKDPGGDNSTAGHELDEFFEILPGGCPQVACSQLRFCSNSNDVISYGTDGSVNAVDGEDASSCATYDYSDTPNIYEADNAASSTGKYYLFFQPKTMRWAASESITGTTEYENCELYKYGKGFTAVANVNDGIDPIISSNSVGSWAASQATAGNIWYWYSTISTDARYIRCIGTLPTPSPTTPAPLVPTRTPLTSDPCDDGVDWAALGAVWGCGTPSPITYRDLTDPPSPAPTVGSGGNNPAAQPATNPVSPPAVTPATAPATNPVSAPAVTPATAPVTHPATNPASAPAVTPATPPATNPVSAPAAQPATNPASAPAAQPATQPATNPVSLPAASQNTDEPTTPSPTYTFGTCVDDFELFDGDGSLSIEYNSQNKKVRITIKGPSGKWFGVGFDSQSMTNTYAIITSGDDISVTERLLYNHEAGYEIDPSTFDDIQAEDVSITSERIISVIRDYAVDTSSDDVYDFTDFIQCKNGKRNMYIITALGSSRNFAKHASKKVDRIFGCNCPDTDAPTMDPTMKPTDQDGSGDGNDDDILGNGGGLISITFVFVIWNVFMIFIV